MFLEVSVLSPEEVIFKGNAGSVILPGEQGVFEVLPFHKRILSRLVSGTMYIDQRSFPLRRGIVMVSQNKVIVIIEKRVGG